MKFRVTISKAGEQIYQSTHEVSKENGRERCEKHCAKLGKSTLANRCWMSQST